MNRPPISTKILTVFLVLFVFNFALPAYSGGVTEPDTSKNKTPNPDSLSTSSKELKSKVHYTADDSIRFDIINSRVLLYGNAKITYEDIQLDAAYVEINWTTRTMFAKGTVDSVGAPIGLPIFKQGEDEFTAHTVTYNFDSEKGKIKQISTQQGEGYVMGETIKKIDENSYFIWKGGYTTCNNPDPHYSISSNKLKVIQNNKIVTGPAYLVIEHVTTPLAIPFGYFPTRKGRAAGILFPSYGESARLGFFLKDGGYYFGIGDVVDFALTGDIYSLGSWGLKLNSNYANRYRYNGTLSVSYSEIKESEPELPDYKLSKDFFIRWNHRQDPKARPNSVFNANVNAGSSDYFVNNISSANNYLTNTFQSSISWSKSWTGKPYNLSASLSHTQNTITHDLSLSLPTTNFSVNRIYPLKRRIATGTEKWYEKVGVSYQNNFQNSIQTIDSILFKSESSDQWRYGMSHSIPLSTSVKALKHFTLSPSFTYNEKWYLSTITKNYSSQTDAVEVDTVQGFKAARDFLFSVSMNTRAYGMVQFKKGKIAAIRHVVSPTISYGYRPDFSDPSFDYYHSYQLDAQGNRGTYSIFENGIYGGPPAGKYGVIGFNLDNNLEMKTRTVTDTSVNVKKIKLFESLAAAISYNTAVDSLQWSLLSISGRTMLFERVSFTFNSIFDPYTTDPLGRRLALSEWDKNHKIARHISSSASVGFSLNNSKQKKSQSIPQQELSVINQNMNQYVDFTVPFNMAINYNITWSRLGNLEPQVNQTLNFGGDVSLTPKWKITFNSGYDFEVNDLSYTQLGIIRDLHCWEMRANWVPFGPQQNYYFQINVKASILQDLKLSKKQDIYD